MSKRITNILLVDVIEFHYILENSDIPTSPGTRDDGLIESAVNAPFATFGGVELYPTLFDKAAQLLYGLIKNHGFIDGNKRTAIHSALMFLWLNKIEVYYTQKELVELAIDVASGLLAPPDIADWFKNHTLP